MLLVEKKKFHLTCGECNHTVTVEVEDDLLHLRHDLAIEELKATYGSCCFKTGKNKCRITRVSPVVERRKLVAIS